MRVVAATQPLSAAAFVLDGVLYGAGGFRCAGWCCLFRTMLQQLMQLVAGRKPAVNVSAPNHPTTHPTTTQHPPNTHPTARPTARFAAAMMLPCAAGSLALMVLGTHAPASAQLPPETQLLWVWAGLTALMALRSVFVGAPLLCQTYPLRCLFLDKQRPAAAAAAAARRRQGAAQQAPPARRTTDLECPLLQDSEDDVPSVRQITPAKT
jgi:hypothetical protein